MLGIVFNELSEMIEKTFGEDMLDDLLVENEDKLPSKGAYTANGVYSHEEIVVLVGALSEKIDVPVPDLVKKFGHYLAGSFVQKYPGFFEECDDTFSFLEKIDAHIHKQVQKLYPDAQLPEFSFWYPDENCIVLSYRSVRNFSSLAQGLIEATAEYYQEKISVEVTDTSDDTMTKVDFHIRRLVS